MSGWVYVISNECIQHLVKVGSTERTPAERIKDFEKVRGAVPGQYAVEYAVLVSDKDLLELHAHAKLGQLSTEYNKDYHKEWFSVTPEDAANTIRDTIPELHGIALLREMGNVLKANHEPFEYICYECKARFTENDAVPFAELSIKPDKRKNKINNDICSDCFRQMKEK